MAHFIDTHTHLFSDAFDADRTEVVENAIRAGVKTLLLPNIDCDSIAPMFALCAEFPNNCFPMLGLHPSYVDSQWEEKLQVIEKEVFRRNPVAIGEIGMDLFWDKTFQQEQTAVFKQQVRWAKELNLPIAIHAREAFTEIFHVLDELNDERLTGVFHCFTGTVDHAKKIQEYGGFKLGIGGVLTYKKSGLDAVLEQLPLESFVLETDAPYLPPTPHRGKRNESAYLLHIAEKLAEVKAVTLKEIAEQTTKNAKELFHLDTYNQLNTPLNQQV
jgi:TatD DNase family protein